MRRFDRRGLERAQQLATARLLEKLGPEGGLDRAVEVSMFLPALFVIVGRATALNAGHDGARRELALLRRMLSVANDDGGLARYDRSCSSPAVTRMVALAIVLATGQLSSPREPTLRIARNPLLDADFEWRLRDFLNGARDYLGSVASAAHAKGELPLTELERIITARIDRRSRVPVLPWLAPGLVAWVCRDGRLTQGGSMSYLWLQHLPALSLIHLTTKRPPGASSRSAAPRFERAPAALRDAILQVQNEDGGWFYNTMTTLLNVLALGSTGLTPEHPVMVRAFAYLRSQTLPAEDGAARLVAWHSQNWNTALAVDVYLRNPRHRADDSAIRPSVELLLAEQAPNGGFAWGRHAQQYADNDTTAVVLKALSSVRIRAPRNLGPRIGGAVRRARAFLTRHQSPGGGYTEFGTSPLSARGPGSIWNPLFFNVATPGVTARVLEGMLVAGASWQDREVERAAAYLVKTQDGSGAWWSRWWAAYIPGTCFAVTALAGLLREPIPARHVHARHFPSARRALDGGLAFLIRHSNADGGWGERRDADNDPRVAGIGPSTPVKTAFAIQALLAGGINPEHRCIANGIGYLLDRMAGDGSWEDDEVAYSIFNDSIYYAHPLPALIMPLGALSDYLRATARECA